MIRPAQLQDAGNIAEIYNYYIKNTVITFEEELVSRSDMEERMQKVWKKKLPFIVVEDNCTIIGFAYLGTWRERSAFDITAETSIYLHKDHLGNGLGSKLYKELIARSLETDLHSLVSAISLPNDISRAIHQKLGFKPIGNFERTGLKFGKLIDVEFWQLDLMVLKAFS